MVELLSPTERAGLQKTLCLSLWDLSLSTTHIHTSNIWRTELHTWTETKKRMDLWWILNLSFSMCGVSTWFILKPPFFNIYFWGITLKWKRKMHMLFRHLILLFVSLPSKTVPEIKRIALSILLNKEQFSHREKLLNNWICALFWRTALWLKLISFFFKGKTQHFVMHWQISTCYQ